jgi:hypothetical protein
VYWAISANCDNGIFTMSQFNSISQNLTNSITPDLEFVFSHGRFLNKINHRDVHETVKVTQHVYKMEMLPEFKVCIQIKMCSNFKLSVSCQVRDVINPPELVKVVTVWS